ncbi:MAG: sigma-70 family RNA polymerase sigma factor [Planctomycetota bacterium]|nr:sigma-70 family RNA polymerase sigma factor [Planctomycetota bacterium]
MDRHQQQVVAEGLREGRPDAWDALFVSFSEPIWRYVTRMMGNQPHDVADVVQETFLAAARSARTYDAQRGTLRMWLWGIAAKQIKLHYRHSVQRNKVKQACLALAQRDSLASINDLSHTPQQTMECQETVTLIRAALVELPSDYGALLTAKYIDGETMQELAEHENSTVAAMNSKLARARQAFRQKFGTIISQTHFPKFEKTK